VHQLEKRDSSEDIVAGRNDGCRCESPFEPDREVNEGYDERKENRDDRSAAQLASDLSGDTFGADDAKTVWPELLREDLLDVVGNIGSAVGLRRNFACILRSNGELAVRAELLDLGAGDVRLIEGRADLSNVRRPDELELHERATCELDAVVGRLDCQRAEAEKDERDRNHGHDLPPADEIVIGVVEYSKHQMLRVAWASRVRLSQII
jgi:hypothetical protein